MSSIRSDFNDEDREDATSDARTPPTAHLRLRGAAASAVVREHQQATGPLANGLHRRFRYSCTRCSGSPPGRMWSRTRRSVLPGKGSSSSRSYTCCRPPPEQCFHWSTHTGAELDLLVMAGARRYGFEVKRSEAAPHQVHAFQRWKRSSSTNSTWSTLGRSATSWLRACAACRRQNSPTRWVPCPTVKERADGQGDPLGDRTLNAATV